MDGLTLVAAVIVALGFLGIFLPVLPGLVLILAGIAVWAVSHGDQTAWATLVLVAVMAVAGMVLQYLIPGRKLAEQGVPGFSIFCGAVLGFIGFFVIPVAGLFIGFVGGIFAAELARLGSADRAWPSTRLALVAVGWNILIEFATAMLMTATWISAMIFAY